MTRNPTPEERATVGYMEHTIAHRDIGHWSLQGWHIAQDGGRWYRWQVAARP